MTSKKSLSERDVCTQFITPAILQSGWHKERQMREEVSFTDGRILIQGKVVKRGKQKRADYILYHQPNVPMAIVEAKDNKHGMHDGLQQAINYGEILDVPFVYTSNGDGFVEHDRLTGQERELRLTAFPSPQDLFERYKAAKGITEEEEKVVTAPYHSDGSGKVPRYYQHVAINRTVEAVTKGQDRVLLVMATGTGKTFTAAQIIWRLWKSGKKKRILFLADRTALVEQTMNNDFKHFGDKMTWVKNRKVDKAYEIYLTLYQSMTGSEEEANVYRQFSPDFFDLIIIDECHRGSVEADSQWKQVLDYFSGATQIGLTATPKETTTASNMDYFGEPIYTYSLKQGIEDGFLAPYKVVRVTLDRDAQGYRPEQGKTDIFGHEVPDKVYERGNFDRDLVIKERTEAVARYITKFLKETGNRFDKTIVFCVDIDHAGRMRSAIANKNADLVKENSKYVVKITGDDEVGKAELYNFTDPESRYPVIATTSKLMTTGVDAQTCKLIVLDSNINSMTEFKQIIGRGTRLKPEFGKHYFTIMDFRGVTELFADPDFDGDPVQIYEATEDEVVPEETFDEAPEDAQTIYEPPSVRGAGEIEDDTARKVYVDGVEVRVVAERVQMIDEHGKLITESLKDYSKKQITKEYSSLETFIQTWDKAKQKYYILQELKEQGVMLEELERQVGADFDPFDLICHIAFDKKKLYTRQERAEKVRKSDYFGQYGDQARQVLEGLLEKYEDEGLQYIEDIKILEVRPFAQIGSPIEIVDLFGGKDRYLSAINQLEEKLYSLKS